MTTTLARCSIAAVAILATAVPANAGGSFSIHVGTPGFGLSFGTTTWAPYGQAWADPGWSVNVGVALDDYGDWVYVSGLGRVWRPWVAAEWRPYTHGRWVWTSVGWTWVAYEPWGWIPHHFGHWAYAPAGWVWVPGTVWHPGNVTWVSHAGWVGWYPCPPRGWSHAARGWHHGYSHGYTHGYADGYGDGWRDARYATWVDWKHLGTAEDVSRVAVTHDRVGRLGTPRAVEVLDRAPSRVAVEARTRLPVTEASLERRAVTIDGRTVAVGRPVGAAVDEGLRRSAPHTVETALSRTAQPSTPARATSRRLETPAPRSEEHARRSTAVVIDDVTVRSLRPRPVPPDVESPATRSPVARPGRVAVPAPSARVATLPERSVPARVVTPASRAASTSSTRVRTVVERPVAAPSPPVARVAPTARSVPVHPERPYPGRVTAPSGRTVSRPVGVAARSVPGSPVTAPSRTVRDAGGVPTGRSATRSAPSPQTAVRGAPSKPAPRSTTSRRSNR